MQTSFPSMNLTYSPSPEVSLRTTDLVVAAGNRTGWQRLTSGIGAIGIAMLAPIGILAIGLPIALAMRALIEASVWLTALVLR